MSMITTVIFDIGNVLMKFDYMPYIRTLLGDEDAVYRVNGAIWRSGYWSDLDRGEDVESVYPRMLEADHQVIGRVTNNGLKRPVARTFEAIVTEQKESPMPSELPIVERLKEVCETGRVLR